MARLLADDAVHHAVHPVGEGQLHGGGDEPRDAAAAVRATADERALLHTECLSSGSVDNVGVSRNNAVFVVGSKSRLGSCWL